MVQASPRQADFKAKHSAAIAPVIPSKLLTSLDYHLLGKLDRGTSFQAGIPVRREGRWMLAR
jgi:hypothetical protein